MAYQLSFQSTHQYLHATVTGENTRENISGYLGDVIRKCREDRVQKLLIEERLTGPRLGFIDLYNLAEEGSHRDLGVLKRIAYVDVFAEKSGDMHFVETVSVNRAVPVRVFMTVDEARDWLISES